MTCLDDAKDNDEVMIDKNKMDGGEKQGGYVGIMKAAEHQKKSYKACMNVCQLILSFLFIHMQLQKRDKESPLLTTGLSSKHYLTNFHI